MADRRGGPGSKSKKGKGTGSRGLHVKVKSAKGRRLSSTRWLQRQLNDPYVIEAKKMGFRSRAAFKIIELDDKFGFLKPGKRILDLGAAPGGWTQIAVERVKSLSGSGKVVALDINPMEDMPGATVICHDFMADDAPDILRDALNGPADVVMSDMAAPAMGHPQTDHLRIMMLCEAALDFAYEVLAPEGVFVAKVFQGGTERQLLSDMKKRFTTVKHAKPPASRKDSAEMYVIATGFKGALEE
ncbi:MAG: RlmE family RNA methyltransferase [Alphaproteobacteria bacterium]|nr:RlmE family RNA methyltransferase [Rhodospirillales bacterium]MCW9044750.1 RlmE family RNA methyltransferase [Alphaproteobacteria bacterium]